MYKKSLRNKVMDSIGEHIKIIRKENFYTQVEFAKVVEISQGTLSDIEL
ncbi:helix-turn-helix domain-containing protein [Cytobacillus citreus]